MPTERERQYYRDGYSDGYRDGRFGEEKKGVYRPEYGAPDSIMYSKPKRKLSAWQRYIKNKRNHITYRDGKLNLKAMGVQYRKKKRR